jgi:hypothetical protein
LLDLLSTMKTNVLLSSIFFIADSVVRGNFTILYLSNRSIACLECGIAWVQACLECGIAWVQALAMSDHRL